MFTRAVIRDNFRLTFFLCGLLGATGNVTAHAAPPESLPELRQFNCGPLPSSGTTSTLDSIMQRPSAPHGVLSVKNERSDTIVLLLSDASGVHRYQALVLGQNEAAQISVPGQMYGLAILNGHSWCNLDAGFSDGMKHHINGGVVVKADDNIRVTVGMSEEPGQISVAYGKPPFSRPRPRPLEQIVRGGVEAQRGEHGYRTTGSINGVPVSFMIDTGASHVTISPMIAQQVGILVCENPSQYSTANGVVVGCQSVVPELTFGPFRLKNVNVSIIPNLASGALLGMEVLKQFSMVWQGDRVRISAIGSDGPKPSPTPLPASPQELPNALEVEWPTPPVVTSLPQPAFAYAVPKNNSVEPFVDGMRRVLLQPSTYIATPFIFIFYLIRIRKQRRRAKSDAQIWTPNSSNDKGTMYYNPKEFRSGNTNSNGSRNSRWSELPRDRLILACGGDRGVAERLVRYERKLNETISEHEAAIRALERLERDRN